MHNHLHFKDTALKTRECLNNSWELLTPQHFRVPVAGIYCAQPSQAKTLTHPVYLGGFRFCFQIRKYATLELSYTEMHSLRRQLLRKHLISVERARLPIFYCKTKYIFGLLVHELSITVLIVTVNFFWPARCSKTHTHTVHTGSVWASIGKRTKILFHKLSSENCQEKPQVRPQIGCALHILL